jgi:hypothetical protein
MEQAPFLTHRLLLNDSAASPLTKILCLPWTAIVTHSTSRRSCRGEYTSSMEKLECEERSLSYGGRIFPKGQNRNAATTSTGCAEAGLLHCIHRAKMLAIGQNYGACGLKAFNNFQLQRLARKAMRLPHTMMQMR